MALLTMTILVEATPVRHPEEPLAGVSKDAGPLASPNVMLSGSRPKVS
jgi:hypothetical protein